jgi:hypothetical protein
VAAGSSAFGVVVVATAVGPSSFAGTVCGVDGDAAIGGVSFVCFVCMAAGVAGETRVSSACRCTMGDGAAGSTAVVAIDSVGVISGCIAGVDVGSGDGVMLAVVSGCRWMGCSETAVSPGKEGRGRRGGGAKTGGCWRLLGALGVGVGRAAGWRCTEGVVRVGAAVSPVAVSPASASRAAFSSCSRIMALKRRSSFASTVTGAAG